MKLNSYHVRSNVAEPSLQLRFKISILQLNIELIVKLVLTLNMYICILLRKVDTEEM